jgi:hypothetical protein
MTINMSCPILKYLDTTPCIEYTYLHTKGLRHISPLAISPSDAAAKRDDGNGPQLAIYW